MAQIGDIRPGCQWRTGAEVVRDREHKTSFHIERYQIHAVANAVFQYNGALHIIVKQAMGQYMSYTDSCQRI